MSRDVEWALDLIEESELKAAGAFLFTRNHAGRFLALGASLYLMALVLPPTAAALQSTGAIDLELNKTVSPQLVTAGEEATWTLTVLNRGPDDATSVEVADLLPAGLTYVSHSGHGILNPASGIWAIGTVPAEGQVSIEIVTTVDAVGQLVNAAEVTMADQEDVDSTPGDGTGDDWDDATVEATAGGGDGELIDLELTLTANPAQVTVGESSTLSVDLANRGPDDATGVAVTVDCPAEITYVSHSGDGAFDATSGGWTVGDLGAGAAVAVEIRTTVDSAGSWVCAAEVTAADQEDVDSTPGDGTGDDWDEATVAAALVLASAIIGDTVWLDADGDGSQDAGESGIAAATVVLTNVDTNAVVTTASNADGLYLFSALEPGNYRVEIDMTTVGNQLSLTTAGTFTVGLADNDACLTADFGLSQVLPRTGFDPVPVTLAGLILVLLGAIALELTWPERAGRRLFMMRRST